MSSMQSSMCIFQTIIIFKTKQLLTHKFLHHPNAYSNHNPLFLYICICLYTPWCILDEFLLFFLLLSTPMSITICFVWSSIYSQALDNKRLWIFIIVCQQEFIWHISNLFIENRQPMIQALIANYFGVSRSLGRDVICLLRLGRNLF